MRKFRIDFETVTESGQLGQSGFNAVQFTNRGQETAQINGEPLPVGETLIINGLPGEVDITIYRVKIAAADTDPAVYVKTKYYVSN